MQSDVGRVVSKLQEMQVVGGTWVHELAARDATIAALEARVASGNGGATEEREAAMLQMAWEERDEAMAAAAQLTARVQQLEEEVQAKELVLSQQQACEEEMVRTMEALSPGAQHECKPASWEVEGALVEEGGNVRQRAISLVSEAQHGTTEQHNTIGLVTRLLEYIQTMQGQLEVVEEERRRESGFMGQLKDMISGQNNVDLPSPVSSVGRLSALGEENVSPFGADDSLNDTSGSLDFGIIR
jgi:hypothetical protein